MTHNDDEYDGANNNKCIIIIRAVPDLLLRNPAGAGFAGFVKQIRPEPDFTI